MLACCVRVPPFYISPISPVTFIHAGAEPAADGSST